MRTQVDLAGLQAQIQALQAQNAALQAAVAAKSAKARATITGVEIAPHTDSQGRVTEAALKVVYSNGRVKWMHADSVYRTLELTDNAQWDAVLRAFVAKYPAR